MINHRIVEIGKAPYSVFIIQERYALFFWVPTNGKVYRNYQDALIYLSLKLRPANKGLKNRTYHYPKF